jgi:hypothetical protein
MLLEDPMPAIESYVAFGLKVFRLAPGEKLPRKGSRGCYDATDDLSKLRVWFHQTRTANVAIACGLKSNITVIDIDPKNGGEVSVAKLAARGLTFPPTLRQNTPNGGCHLIYRHAPQIKNWSNIKGLGDGIDTRNDGGLIVVAPSRAPLLADKEKMGRYQWIDSATGEIIRDTPILSADDTVAEFPAWVLEEIEALNRKPSYRAFQPIRPLTNEAAQARLTRQTDLIRSEHEGNRNGGLSSRAYFAYKNYVLSGVANESALAAQLLSAGLSIGLDRKESVETIEKAFAAARRKSA